MPFRHPPSRLSFSESEAVDAQMDEWLKEGIVRHSVSNFASRIVVVKKNDGSNQVCVD